MSEWGGYESAQAVVDAARAGAVVKLELLRRARAAIAFREGRATRDGAEDDAELDAWREQLYEDRLRAGNAADSEGGEHD